MSTVYCSFFRQNRRQKSRSNDQHDSKDSVRSSREIWDLLTPPSDLKPTSTMTLTEDSVQAFITNYTDTWSECGKAANPKLWEDFMVRASKLQRVGSVFISMCSHITLCRTEKVSHGRLYPDSSLWKAHAERHVFGNDDKWRRDEHFIRSRKRRFCECDWRWKSSLCCSDSEPILHFQR